MSRAAQDRIYVLNRIILFPRAMKDKIEASDEIQSITEEESGITKHFDEFVDKFMSLF
jgi:hypothetical protein